ncbi:hypothetical protein B296_00053862, partial [Ensete ventricosum]
VLEQDVRAGDGGCCYLPAWEQDAKMVGKSWWPQVQVVAWLACGGRSRVGNGRWQQVSSTRSDLNRVRTEENSREFGQEQRKTSKSSVLCSAGLGSTSSGRRRRTSVRDRSVKEEKQIWFGIARLDAQAAAEVGLSWSRLPPRRIRHCDCRRGELGVTVVDLEVIGVVAAFRRFSPLAIIADPL